MVRKTLVAQQRTTANSTHIITITGNRTGVTLVRGERFTHKPTMPRCKLDYIRCSMDNGNDYEITNLRKFKLSEKGTQKQKP